MKRDRKSKHFNSLKYEIKYDDYQDTRFYGLWISDHEKVKLDPKRFQKALNIRFADAQLKVINKRRTHYFYPRKAHYYDYACNVFEAELCSISEDWNNNVKPLVQMAVSRIEQPNQYSPGDYGNYMMGISSAAAANAWAIWKNTLNERSYRQKVVNTVYSQYSQFIHRMASRIEAVTVKILTDRGMIDKHFDRNILYGGIRNDTPVRSLAHFSSHDKLYSIWNFLKHNSLSTYETLKERFPEILSDNHFVQGNEALYYVKLSDELISELIMGCSLFLKEYCELIFNENYDEAQWNYGQYFYKMVKDRIEDINNPLGLGWWDDID